MCHDILKGLTHTSRPFFIAYDFTKHIESISNLTPMNANAIDAFERLETPFYYYDLELLDVTLKTLKET